MVRNEALLHSLDEGARQKHEGRFQRGNLFPRVCHCKRICHTKKVHVQEVTVSLLSIGNIEKCCLIH